MKYLCLVYMEEKICRLCRRLNGRCCPMSRWPIVMRW